MSGMTLSHIKDACKQDRRCKQALHDLIKAMLNKSLPGLEDLTDCDGLPFGRDEDDKIRPIAVSEAIYRIASKCAITMVHDHEVSLSPLQHAFGVSGGPSIVAHALRAAITHDSSTVILSADFKNAFNTLTRASILQAIRSSCPYLQAYFHFAYGAPSNLCIRLLIPALAALCVLVDVTHLLCP